MEKMQEIWSHSDFFETMYQSVPCGILHTIDDQGKTGYLMNNQGARILGFSTVQQLQEKHPETIEGCFLKQDLDIIYNAIRECKSRKEVVSYRCSCLWDNQEVHYLQAQSQMISINHCCMIQTIFFDITDQILIEKNREIYRSVINNAAKAFFSIYVINLVEDTFSTITQSQNTEKVISSKGNYWDNQKLYIHKFVHPEDQERLLNKLSIPFLKSLKEDISPIEMEYRTLHEDGAYHWTRIQVIPASTSEDGYTEVVTVTNTDIDSQKKEEELLREQDLWKTKLNNLVLENSNVRDFCYYPKDDCLIFPERTMKTYGVQEKYENGMISFLDNYIDEVYFNDCKEALIQASKGKNDISVELRLKKSKEWCRVKLHIVQIDEDGAALNILGIIENLTELKKIDTDNKIMHEMCDYSVKSHYELMLLIDRSTLEYQIFSTASPLYKKIPNKGNYDKVIKKIIKYGFLSQVETEFDFSLAELVKQLENKKVPSIEKVFKCSGFHDDIYWKKLEYSYLPSDKTKIMMLVTDVTDTEIRKEELKEAVDVAEAANEAKSSFLANMSHEIRTPMNAIIGMGEILLHRPLDEDVKNGLIRIQNVSEGLLSIINDILDFSKIESGKFEFVSINYDLRVLLLDVANLISMRLQEKDIYFLIKLDASVPQKLIGDDIRIKQILVNLIGNAVKFTEHGFIEVSIHGAFIPGKKSHYRLVIDIKDTGTGIKDEDKKNIFGQFMQVDTTKNRKVTGTGLGLAISKNMAQAMGGDITVESVYGEGSTFHLSMIQEIDDDFSLNVVSDKNINVLICLENPTLVQYIGDILNDLGVAYTLYDQTIPQEKFTHFVTSRNHFLDIDKHILNMFDKNKIILLYRRMELEEHRYKDYIQLPLSLVSLQIPNILNGMKVEIDVRKKEFDYKKIKPVPRAKILIVDDNMTNLYVCEELMKPYQMEIDTVDSGYKAIDKASQTQYDLIFMDQMMPGMDGIETTSKIRELNSYYRHSFIIALSANALAGAREQFIQQGFDDYLEKPIKMVELNRIIKTYLIPLKYEENQSIHLSTIDNHDKLNVLYDFDITKALEVFAGDINVYHTVLSTYLEDMIERRRKLGTIIENQNIHLFTIYVHAIKSASRSVGAFEFAQLAEDLEHLGSENKWKDILLKIDHFMIMLSRIIKQVQTYLDVIEVNSQKVNKEKREKPDIQLLIQLKDICESMEYDQAEEVIDSLCQYEYEKDIELKMTNMKKYYEDFDYENMEKVLKSLMEEL